MENVLENTYEEAVILDDSTADLSAGHDAGTQFSHRHILEKINLFIDEYRRHGYTEDFIEGFLDGVNDITGSNISLMLDEESDESELTTPE